MVVAAAVVNQYPSIGVVVKAATICNVCLLINQQKINNYFDN